MKINILLCDDDVPFLEKLAEAITKQVSPKGLKTTITRSAHPASLTDRQLTEFQMMFLDIDMEERNGMTIARRVRELHLRTIIIFVTNYPQFSLEGYEVRAFRYLLKYELEKKLPLYYHDAMMEILRTEKALRFSINAEPYSIPYSNIIYLESRQRIIYLHTVKLERSGDHFYGRIDKLTEELEAEGFLRVQKSYLVNMVHIKKLNFDRVLLSNGEELPVSQKNYSKLKILYLGWKNEQWGTPL